MHSPVLLEAVAQARQAELRSLASRASATGHEHRLRAWCGNTLVQWGIRLGGQPRLRPARPLGH
jgi:hypothetical protein